MPSQEPPHPDQPQMFPPEPPAPESPMAPVPPSPMAAPAPSEVPSPIGLIIAGMGLVMLCVSVLLPRVSIEYDDGDDYGYFGLSSLSGGQAFAIDTSSVVLTVALLFAVGLSAHGAQALRWPTRMAAVGLAALTAAFAYHPITVIRQLFQDYEDSGSGFEDTAESTAEIVIEADSGLYLAVIAVALLAASTFFMRLQRRPQVYYPMPPAPAAGPQTAATITVTPG